MDDKQRERLNRLNRVTILHHWFMEEDGDDGSEFGIKSEDYETKEEYEEAYLRWMNTIAKRR